jgi:hypothetical protein
MSSSTLPIPPTELTDTDLEPVAAGKDLVRTEFSMVTPGFWGRALNRNNWQVRTGPEAVNFLVAANLF